MERTLEEDIAGDTHCVHENEKEEEMKQEQEGKGQGTEAGSAVSLRRFWIAPELLEGKDGVGLGERGRGE